MLCAFSLQLRVRTFLSLHFWFDEVLLKKQAMWIPPTFRISKLCLLRQLPVFIFFNFSDGFAFEVNVLFFFYRLDLCCPAEMHGWCLVIICLFIYFSFLIPCCRMPLMNYFLWDSLNFWWGLSLNWASMAFLIEVKDQLEQEIKAFPVFSTNTNFHMVTYPRFLHNFTQAHVVLCRRMLCKSKSLIYN